MRKLFTSALVLTALLAVARMADADGPVVVAPVVIGCQGSCGGECLTKVCKPIVVPKTIVKPCYTSVCEDYCEPRCWSCGLSGLFGRGCDTCGPNHSCGDVKTRKIMIVKLKRTETCVNKCEVDYVPACATHCSTPCAAPCAAPCATPAHGTHDTETIIVQPAPQGIAQSMPVGR